MEDKKFVYMDHAATTFTKKEVLDEMLPYFTEEFGNPSSVYSFSRATKKAVETAREKVAKAIGAKDDEIFFTGGGSEADNWAIKGVAFANRKKGNHIITTKIEHHAVLHTCEFLEKNGFEVTYLPVDEYGMVSVDDVKNAITDKTILISVMFANNEVGTIEPIKEIGKIAHEKGIYFHTDAVQAVGNVPIDVNDMNIDLLSLAGHKFYGPKGVGALYIRKGVKIDNLIHGGGQEKGRRAGTENIPGIVGLGKAIEMATSDIEGHSQKLRTMRDKMIKGIQENIPYAKLNGHREKRLPGNINFSFSFIEGESMLLLLDQKGICASTGSACSSGSLEPSHVLMAMGLPHELAHGSIRLTLGDLTKEEDIDYVLDALKEVVSKLRGMSPLYDDFIKNGGK